MQKFIPKKTRKVWEKGTNMMPKWMPKYMICSNVFKRDESWKTMRFSIENVVQTMQKGINNRSKIDAKSKPEKRLPTGAKMNQKWTKFDDKIHPKFKKGAKWEPRGRQQSQKSRKKGKPKTNVEKGRKMEPKHPGPVLARRNARGQSKDSNSDLRRTRP